MLENRITKEKHLYSLLVCFQVLTYLTATLNHKSTIIITENCVQWGMGSGESILENIAEEKDITHV